MSSAMATAGWVSLSWTATKSASRSSERPFLWKRRKMSWNVAETKKYSWLRRSSRPTRTDSDG